MFPLSDSRNLRTNDVCYSIINPQEITTGYMDLTGRFRKRSIRRNEHVSLGCHLDANHIRVAPIKNRKGSTIAEAWKQLQSTFKKIGLAPKTYVLDNEISGDLLEAFKNQDVDYQIVTPFKHRNNQA